MSRFLILAFALLCFGCTRAGPFITDISFNADKSVTVTKCAVEHNYLSGRISTEDCQTTTVRAPI